MLSLSSPEGRTPYECLLMRLPSCIRTRTWCRPLWLVGLAWLTPTLVLWRSVERQRRGGSSCGESAPAQPQLTPNEIRSSKTATEPPRSLDIMSYRTRDQRRMIQSAAVQGIITSIVLLISDLRSTYVRTPAEHYDDDDKISCSWLSRCRERRRLASYHTSTAVYREREGWLGHITHRQADQLVLVLSKGRRAVLCCAVWPAEPTRTDCMSELL